MAKRSFALVKEQIFVIHYPDIVTLQKRSGDCEEFRAACWAKCHDQFPVIILLSRIRCIPVSIYLKNVFPARNEFVIPLYAGFVLKIYPPFLSGSGKTISLELYQIITGRKGYRCRFRKNASCRNVY